VSILWRTLKRRTTLNSERPGPIRAYRSIAKQRHCLKCCYADFPNQSDESTQQSFFLPFL
jgi:hypothetical protein